MTAQQDRPARPPSKTAKARAEATARREARDARRIATEARLVAARAKAVALCKSMPPGFSEWGVVRTRAYVRLLEIVGSKAENVTMKAHVLEGYLAELERAPSWPLAYCQHLSMLHGRAVDIQAPDA